MPEQPIGAPRLSDDFDESQPGLPFRRVEAPDPRADATPLAPDGELMTSPEVAAASADWLGAVGPGRLVPGETPGEFVLAGEAPGDDLGAEVAPGGTSSPRPADPTDEMTVADG
jgi:hypothetical protein